jgi:hypothetical protein
LTPADFLDYVLVLQRKKLITCAGKNYMTGNQMYNFSDALYSKVKKNHKFSIYPNNFLLPADDGMETWKWTNVTCRYFETRADRFKKFIEQFESGEPLDQTPVDELVF